MKEVYFDNASTALPVFKYETLDLGNPSTSHAYGIRAERELTNARRILGRIIGCDKNEVIFTSGGTESNNLAILGYGFANRRNNVSFHALPGAHPSVLESIKSLTNLGFGVSKELDISSISQLCEHSFISLPQVCHETGEVYNIEEIAAKLKKMNTKTIVHIDGVQGFCKERLSMENIDLYSVSSHKIHGPSGVGGLMVKKGVRLMPILSGGNQEQGLRAGTQNTNGAIQFAHTAQKLHENMDANKSKVLAVKTELLKITQELDFVSVNSPVQATPYILSMSFLGVLGEVLMNMLSEKRIFVSTGAACKRNSSPLSKMGFMKELAESSIRFGLSHHNTVEEAEYTRNVIKDCVVALRKVGTGKK